MMTSAAAGYSGTPLAKKLGIGAGSRIVALDAPAEYVHALGELPEGVKIGRRAGADTHIAHVFATRRAELSRHLVVLRKALAPDAAVRVSWPKKAAKVPTDITEDTIRELALPLGFVDVKVCAVTDAWSGLKLVVRKELR
jgi:hypothetical protein